MKRYIRIIFALVLAWGALLPELVCASEREYALKAGFIFNFARYSDGLWFSPGESRTYKICSRNNDFVKAAKTTLKGQTIASRPVQVEWIGGPVEGCHSLYVSSHGADSAEFIKDEQFGQTMLIGESSEFIHSGGHLRFFIAGGKVRFEVSPYNLKAANINLSSKVLRMGRVVRGSK